MTIDVLHHTDDPIKVLKEMKRVSKRYILIKDHTANHSFDRFILKFMDYVGNRLYGVALPYNYLSNKAWLNAFKQTRLEVIKKTKRFYLYPWPFDLIFGRKLHCLYLLKK
jgi:ubiquinone/menaquinone biosynthesis C-methylase UbiE